MGLFIAVFCDFLFDCQLHTGGMSGNPAGEITVSSWVLTIDLMIKDIKKLYFGSNLLIANISVGFPNNMQNKYFSLFLSDSESIVRVQFFFYFVREHCDLSC